MSGFRFIQTAIAHFKKLKSYTNIFVWAFLFRTITSFTKRRSYWATHRILDAGPQGTFPDEDIEEARYEAVSGADGVLGIFFGDVWD